MFELLTPFNCILLLVGAMGIGLSKSGFAGIAMLHVLVYAVVFGTKASTGVLLPMLVVGDVLAIIFFGKKAQWEEVRKLLPPALIGVAIGAVLMDRLSEATFKPLVGVIILALTLVQLLRMWRPKAFGNVPHNHAFAWGLGLLAGVATMMANAAGPIVALYLLAISLPKMELVGTAAWFFLVVNVCKLPISYGFLNLINLESLAINLIFSPGILIGMFAGRWLLTRIPQKAFNYFLLAFTGLVAVRMIFGGTAAQIDAPESTLPSEPRAKTSLG